VEPAEPVTDGVKSIDQLWEGFDPRALPLEVEIIASEDQGGVHLETLYFTGEIFEGEKVRVFAYRGWPAETQEKLPGVLHIHGGGQTANAEWVRFWARKGYACVSFDFCGNTNLPELTPNYKREHYTKWGKVPADMMKLAGGGLQVLESARSNAWYHWAIAARRGLTMLESLPQVDPERLGTFGISMGGTLTWVVAGIDERVKAAAPIYGCGWETHHRMDKFSTGGFGLDAKEAWAKLLGPESYAPRITCPMLWLNSTNDFHGKLDWGFRTLDLLPATTQRSQVFTINQNHHIAPEEGRSLPLWMETHLKGAGSWPRTPELAVEVADGVPQVVVTPDPSQEIERVELYYALDEEWPLDRFWRTIEPVSRQGDQWVGPAPYYGGEDAFKVGKSFFHALANVTYKSGVRISSRLLEVKPSQLPGVRPTSIKKVALIDAMETDRDWRWIAAYTDPQHETGRYFEPWVGPNGEQGFTLDSQRFPHDRPMRFHFGTRAFGEPPHDRKDATPLLLDIYAPNLPDTLKVYVDWRGAGVFVGLGPSEAVQFSWMVDMAKVAADKNGDSPWLTLRMLPGDFQAEGRASLPTWLGARHFRLEGTSPAGKPPVFGNLRWEE
jgi:dienelactone hydrolase